MFTNLGKELTLLVLNVRGSAAQAVSNCDWLLWQHAVARRLRHLQGRRHVPSWRIVYAAGQLKHSALPHGAGRSM